MTTETNAEEIELLFKFTDAIFAKLFDISDAEWHQIDEKMLHLRRLIAKNRKLSEAKSPVGSSDECMWRLIEILEHNRCSSCSYDKNRVVDRRCDNCCRKVQNAVAILSRKWINDRKSQKSV